MLIFVPSISAETCIEIPPWTKHQMVGNESHVLTAAKAKRAATSRCASSLYSRCSLCSNPARNHRFRNYIEISQKRYHTASCSNSLTKLEKVQLTLTAHSVRCLGGSVQLPGPQRYACSTLLVWSVVVISDVTWTLQGGQNLVEVENVESVRAVIWLDLASDLPTVTQC